MVYWCLFSFIIVVILVFIDDRRGCVKVTSFYIACLVITLIIISLRSCFKALPTTNYVVRQTTEGIRFEYNNNSYKCPSKSTFYCVVKNDSIEKPNRHDTCVHCGQIFREHQYMKTYEEKKWDDAIREAFTETPAE